MKKGFTLIELLVVISIISLLSSVVLSSVSNARAKGVDGAIKSQMLSARTQAELYYAYNGNDYRNVCTPDPQPNGAKPIGKLLLVAGKYYLSTMTVVIGSAGAFNQTTCHESPTAWAAETPLKGSVSGVGGSLMWCIDSTGASKQENSNLPQGIYSCQ